MGASISYDTKYKMSMDIDVECITLYPAKSASETSKSKKHGGGSSSKVTFDDEHSDSGSGSESGSGSGSGSDSGAESDSGSSRNSRSDDDSGSDSDGELKRVPVKITPEIAGYIRNYVRGNDFMEILDDLTEFDLEPYGYMKDTALVFDAQSVSYDSENKCIESVGMWNYIPPKGSASKNKKKQSGGYYDDEDEEEQDDGKTRRNKRKHSSHNDSDYDFKTKDDEVDASNILNILRENFNVASKNNEFIIHKTKTNMLMLNISGVDISKV